MARKRIIDVTGSTTTLSKNQSGSLVVLSRAAGIVVTLPNVGRGLEYEFVVKTAVTSNRYRIVGNDSAKMRGVIAQASAGGASVLHVGDGATHIALNMYGTSSGGLIGTNFKFVCDNDGVWNVVGENVISGGVSLDAWSTS